MLDAAAHDVFMILPPSLDYAAGAAADATPYAPLMLHCHNDDVAD